MYGGVFTGEFTGGDPLFK